MHSPPDAMSGARRASLIISAGIFIMLGLLIALSNPLPQRAFFTAVNVTPDQPLSAPEINAYAPDFTLQTIEGQNITLSDLRGQAVILNFWATWCIPCRVEMPMLQTLYENYTTKPIQILAVNVGESPDQISAWQQQQALTYPLLIDEAQHTARLYQLRGQPSTYIISPQGIITAIFFGPVDEHKLAAALG